jgi:hypothetical protein
MRIFRMALVGGFAGAFMAGNVGTLHAAPLPTNVATIKSMVADSSIQVRWGGWRGGWGHRGFGGWGLGAGALAGAVIGGAIASGAYGYYGGPAYGYGGPPYYGDYYPGYSYYPAYVGPYYYGSWQAIQEPGAFRFRPYGPWGYW